jgi:two-component system sensor histidine kinase KdpD
MIERRPTPEELLARVKLDEASSSRGKLKIFLGMAPGVGKTYTMLEAAQKLQDDGIDVVAGCVVTHGRKETEKLIEGLEIIPEKELEYRGVTLKEFDLDSALKRHPQVLLVDEFAHTNAPGSRHEKRWQDIDELLNAGIHVYTTLNVQHLESMNDVVAQITRIVVRETVPDSVLETAHEIELVDLPPDELIERMHQGKVYMPDQSKAALENFFRKGNLIALRELALRFTAERVDAQMEKYRQDASIKHVWPASERILVCIGPHPLSARLVRATKRMATGLHASAWTAVYVETPKSARLPEQERNRVIRTLQLAERLGAETAILTGNNVSEELVSYARKKNVSKIVIGKPVKARWTEMIFGSIVDELIRKSGDIDVYVITGEGSQSTSTAVRQKSESPVIRHYIYSIVLVALITWFSRGFIHKLAQENLVMLYLLIVVIASIRWGMGPSVLAAVLGVACFDFFCVTPYFSFAVSDTQYLITFAIMLLVGLVLSTLTSTVKKQAEMARKRERHTSALYAMTRELAAALDQDAVLKSSFHHITEVFECAAAVFCPDESGQIASIPGLEPSLQVDSKELGVAQWVYLNQTIAGMGTSTLPGAKALYIPLKGSQGAIGVIGIRPKIPEKFLDPEEMHLMETFVNQMALALERANLSRVLSSSKQNDHYEKEPSNGDRDAQKH